MFRLSGQALLCRAVAGVGVGGAGPQPGLRAQRLQVRIALHHLEYLPSGPGSSDVK